MHHFISRQLSRHSLHVVIAILTILLSISGHLPKFIQISGLSYLQQQALEHLTASKVQAEERFLILSTTKAAVTVIESSDVGLSLIIDANVQLGSAFVAIKHLINKAWDASIWGLSLLLIADFLIQSGSVLLRFFLIALSSLFLFHLALIYIREFVPSPPFKSFFSRTLLRVKRVFRWMAFVGLVTTLMPSITVLSTSIVTHTLSSDMHQAISGGLASHNQQYVHILTETKLEDSAKQFLKKVRTERHKIDGFIKTFHTYVYQHIALILLETLLIPFAIFGVFCIALRLCCQRL